MKIRRAKFKELNQDLFKQCMEIVKKCLKDSKTEKHQIEEVVPVEGLSHIPKIQELLRQFFDDKKLCHSVNPDEAVAYGAAVQAAVLNNESINLVLVDVTPFSLGISVCNGVMEVGVPRNTRIPTRKEISVTTGFDNQDSGDIEVYEGERALVADNNFLGNFILHGIPPARCGVPSIKVCFDLDADGILKVSALEQETGRSNSITISNEREIVNKEEIDRMVADAETFRREDEEAKKKHFAKNNIECFIFNTRSRVTKGKINGRVEACVAEDVMRTLTDVEEWLDENDDAGLGELTAKLEELKIKRLPSLVLNL